MKKKGLKYNVRSERRHVIPIKIFVDGVTEIDYFQRINELIMLSNISIQAEIGKYEKFKDYRRRNPLKQVMFIEDIDGVSVYSKNQQKKIKYQKLLSILNKSNGLGDSIFYNNYSFETWLLNHKKNSIQK